MQWHTHIHTVCAQYDGRYAYPLDPQYTQNTQTPNSSLLET